MDAANELGIHRIHAVPSGVRELLEDFEQALLSTVFDEDFVKQVNAVSKAQRPAIVRRIQADIALLREAIAAGLGQSKENTTEQWESINRSLIEVRPSSIR